MAFGEVTFSVKQTLHTFLTITWFEWRTNLLNRRLWRNILIAVLFPFVVLCLLFFVFLVAEISSNSNSGWIGLIDDSHFVCDEKNPCQNTGVVMIYPDMQAARQALRNGDVVIVYHIPPGFPDVPHVKAYELQAHPAPKTADDYFKDWLEAFLRMKAYDTEGSAKDIFSEAASHTVSVNTEIIITKDNALVHISPDSTPHPVSISTLLLTLFHQQLPVGLMLVLVFTTQKATRLFSNQAIHREYDNDILEILISSVSRPVFFLGKATGITLGGLTLSIWLWPFLLFALFTSAQRWYLLLILGGVLLTMYMDNIRRVAIVHIFNLRGIGVRLLGMAILILLMLVMASTPYAILHPNAPLSVAVTFIPFATPFMLILRSLYSNIPLWQVVAVLLFSAGYTAFLLWVKTRQMMKG